MLQNVRKMQKRWQVIKKSGRIMVIDHGIGEHKHIFSIFDWTQMYPIWLFNPSIKKFLNPLKYNLHFFWTQRWQCSLSFQTQKFQLLLPNLLQVPIPGLVYWLDTGHSAINIWRQGAARILILQIQRGLILPCKAMAFSLKSVRGPK